jgi:hypothetical protein
MIALNLRRCPSSVAARLAVLNTIMLTSEQAKIRQQSKSLLNGDEIKLDANMSTIKDVSSSVLDQCLGASELKQVQI